MYFKHLIGAIGGLLLCLPLIGQEIESMEAIPYPYPVEKVALNDSLEIAYADEGQGDQTLLFIHGLGSYLKAWQRNIDSLRSNYRCIAIDLPGYGKSSKAQYDFSMDFFAEAIAGLVHELEPQNLTLVGHSMGGQIALTYALKYPESLEQLILFAPAGLETFTPQQQQWLESVYTPAFVKNTPDTQIVKNFELNFFDMPDNARFMIEDRLAMRSTKEYDYYCAMIPRCMQAMLRGPVYQELPEIKTPTLLLFGEEDDLIPNKYLHPELTTEKVAQIGMDQLPNCQMQWLPKAGHFAQWEAAALANQAIRNFLDQ